MFFSAGLKYYIIVGTILCILLGIVLISLYVLCYCCRIQKLKDDVTEVKAPVSRQSTRPKHAVIPSKSLIKHVFELWVPWRVPYKRQELLTLREHMSSPLVFGGVCVAHLFSFLCCPITCLYVLCSVMWCLMAHVLFTLFVFFVSIVVCNIFCVVFLFCSSSSISPVSLDFPFLIAPSVFSNVYLWNG